MKTRRRAKGILLPLVGLVISAGLLASYAFTEPKSTDEDGISGYQTVVDKLNEEFKGTGTHAVLAAMDDSLPDIQDLGTLKEFESSLRAEMEQAAAGIQAANRALTAAIEKGTVIHAEHNLVVEKIYDENGDVIGYTTVPKNADGQETVEAVSESQRSPHVGPPNSGTYNRVDDSASWGGIPHVSGTITDGNDFWQWSSIAKAGTTWYEWYPYSAFLADAYRYHFTDNARTCAVTYYGYQYSDAGASGVYTSKHVEFSAGSAAKVWGSQAQR